MMAVFRKVKAIGARDFVNGEQKSETSGVVFVEVYLPNVDFVSS